MPARPCCCVWVAERVSVLVGSQRWPQDLLTTLGLPSSIACSDTSHSLLAAP